MKLTKHIIWLSFIAFLTISTLTVIIHAQDTSRVKVRIMNFKWNDSSESIPDKMSTYQIEWWLKEGQKKFPGICITTENGVADYTIAWTSTQISKTHTYDVPKTSTTQHSGNVNGTSTSTGSTDSVNTI